MEPAPKNVPLVDNPDADTLFEGQSWWRDVIDFCAVVVQNQNDLSFQKWLDIPKPFLDQYMHTMSHSQMQIIVFILT